MNKYLRSAIPSAVFGLVVSLLGGIFGTIPLPVMLLRSILISALAAGIGVLIRVLLEKQLPELLYLFKNTSDDNTIPADASNQGEMVNIVVDDTPSESEVQLGEEEIALTDINEGILTDSLPTELNPEDDEDVASISETNLEIPELSPIDSETSESFEEVNYGETFSENNQKTPAPNIDLSGTAPKEIAQAVRKMINRD